MIQPTATAAALRADASIQTGTCPPGAPNTLEKWFCWLAIAFGVFLRVFRFWEPSLWIDEMVTAHIALAPDAPTLWQRCRISYELPVHQFLSKLFLSFGHNEFFLRLPSVLCGVAAIFVLYACLRRFVGSRGALYATAIYALNSNAILHSQDARIYGLAMLLSLLSIYSFLQILDGAPPRWLLFYGVITLVTCYNQVLYTCVLLGQIALVAGQFLVSKQRSPQRKSLLWTQALLAVLLTPVALFMRSLGSGRSTLYSWIPTPSASWFVQFFIWPDVHLALAAVPGLFLVWKKRRQWSWRNPAEAAVFWLGVLYIAIWPAAIVAARLGIINILLGRYLFPCLFGVLIVVAVSAAKSRDPILAAGLSAYIALMGFFQASTAMQYGPWVNLLLKQEWRAAAEWIQEQYRPGDVVLLRSGLSPVRVWSPTEPGVQDYLSCPLTGLCARMPMTVYNLPWSARELATSDYSPPALRKRALHARRLFVLVNLSPGGWDWKAMDQWLLDPAAPPPHIEERGFGALEIRLYRFPAAAPVLTSVSPPRASP
jgi:hypothetical protein